MKLRFLLGFLLLTSSASRTLVSATDDSEENHFVSQPMTSENYKDILGNNKNVFVKFFTNW